MMRDIDEPDPRPAGGQLFAEASVWFSHMRGPEADAYRPAFEAWLARGALHLAAYNRAAEIFAMGKFLEDANMPLIAEPTPRPRRLLAMIGIALLALLGVLLGSFLMLSSPFWSTIIPVTPARRGTSIPARELATLEMPRQLVLEDGSRISLAPHSLLRVDYDRRYRRLRLERGRARFDVAHEARPFIVAAGQGNITARGTIFDVALSAARMVEVRLIRGKIDVGMPSGGRQLSASRQIIQLTPGEEVAYAARPSLPVAPRALSQGAAVGREEFDRAPLREIIARANSTSPVKILLAGDATGDLRVSGAFRIDDGALLARQVALLADLTVDRTDPARLVLRPMAAR